MNPMTLDDTVVRNQDVLAVDTGTEVLAMDEQSGNCFSMSGSGRLIWECSAQPVSVRAICVRLRSHYRVDEHTCITQTLRYVTTLIDEGLMQRAPAAP
jgi:hypothetical protein